MVDEPPAVVDDYVVGKASERMAEWDGLARAADRKGADRRRTDF
jgi:hypothetical protein